MTFLFKNQNCVSGKCCFSATHYYNLLAHTINPQTEKDFEMKRQLYECFTNVTLENTGCFPVIKDWAPLKASSPHTEKFSLFLMKQRQLCITVNDENLLKANLIPVQNCKVHCLQSYIYRSYCFSCLQVAHIKGFQQ